MIDFVKLKLIQVGENPILGDMKIILNDKDITQSVRSINIHAGYDEITIVNLEFIALVDADIDKDEIK